MAQDAPKRRFLSLIFLVSCFSKSLLIRIKDCEENRKIRNYTLFTDNV